MAHSTYRYKTRLSSMTIFILLSLVMEALFSDIKVELSSISL